MKLTKKQIETLEDVFSFAVDKLQREKEMSFMFEMSNGKIKSLDIDAKLKDIDELFNYFKQNIES